MASWMAWWWWWLEMLVGAGVIVISSCAQRLEFHRGDLVPPVVSSKFFKVLLGKPCAPVKSPKRETDN